MSQYSDFKTLVKENIQLAEENVRADMCYGMGKCEKSEGNEWNTYLRLSELDEAYENDVYICNSPQEWRLVVKHLEQNKDEIFLGTISKTYKRGQIAIFLADLYLTFYQNFRLYD